MDPKSDGRYGLCHLMLIINFLSRRSVSLEELLLEVSAKSRTADKLLVDLSDSFLSWGFYKTKWYS